MSQALQRFASVNLSASDTFAEHLDVFAADLSATERSFLEAVIVSTMTPHQRVLATEQPEMLDAAERALLDELFKQTVHIKEDR